MKPTKSILALCCIFCCFAVNGQTKEKRDYFLDTSSVPIYDWKTINIGFPASEGTEQIPFDPLLRIDTISTQEFLKLSKKYGSSIVMDTTLITRTDTSFTIQVEESQITFASNVICECTSSDYAGLIVPLNLFFVYSVDMHNEIAYANLVDKRTGKFFGVPSDFDQGPQDILLSPQEGFLLTYSSSYYEHDNSGIYIMSIDRDQEKKKFALNNYLNINFDRLNIEDLAWISENAFVMSVTEQLNPEDNDAQKIKYCLKITLKK